MEKTLASGDLEGGWQPPAQGHASDKGLESIIFQVHVFEVSL